jgi:hypothetical protein
MKRKTNSLHLSRETLRHLDGGELAAVNGAAGDWTTIMAINGTLTDNNTGLVWEKKSDDGGLHDKDNYYYWSGNSVQETLWDWIEDVNAQAFGGAQDWRIPNTRELLSIAVFQGPVPAAFNNNCVPGATVFTGSCTNNIAYWTSTSRISSTIGGASTSAWYANSGGTVYPDFKSNARPARAVRRGTP